MQVSRREFTEIMLTILGTSLMPITSSLAQTEWPSFDLPSDIANKFLQIYPQGLAEAKELKNDLILRAKDQEEIKQLIRDLVFRDFTQNRCFDYKSWHLSYTEGLICSLSQEKS